MKKQIIWIKEHKKELAVSAISLGIGAAVGIGMYKFRRRDLEAWYKKCSQCMNETNMLTPILKPAIPGSNAVTCTNLKKSDANRNFTLGDCQEIIESLTKVDGYNPKQGITGMAIFLKGKEES